MPVVHRALLQLSGELPENIHPGQLPGPRNWCRWPGRDGDHPFDDLDSAASGRCRAGLLPRPVPAGRRAPLRDRSPRPRGDRLVAPPARRGCGPPARTARAALCCRAVRRCRLPRDRSLLLLTATPLAIALASPVVTAALATHAPERPG